MLHSPVLCPHWDRKTPRRVSASNGDSATVGSSYRTARRPRYTVGCCRGTVFPGEPYSLPRSTFWRTFGERQMPIS